MPTEGDGGPQAGVLVQALHRRNLRLLKMEERGGRGCEQGKGTAFLGWLWSLCKGWEGEGEVR